MISIVMLVGTSLMFSSRCRIHNLNANPEQFSGKFKASRCSLPKATENGIHIRHKFSFLVLLGIPYRRGATQWSFHANFRKGVKMPNGPYRTQLVSHVVRAVVRWSRRWTKVPNTGDDIRSMDDCQQNYNIAVLTYHGIEIRRCHTDLTPQLGGFWLIIRICVSHKQECARIVIFSHSFIAFILVLSRFVCF